MDLRNIIDKLMFVLFRLIGKSDRNRNYLLKSACMASDKLSDKFHLYRERSKKSDIINVIDNFAETPVKSAIVIQGPVKTEDDFTLETVRLYKKYYPEAKIIVSTWKETAAEIVKSLKNAGAEVLLNDRPSVSGLGNVNFQVVSSKAGVDYAAQCGCERVLKTRTDQRIYKPYFMEYFEALVDMYPVKPDLKQNKRIIAGPGIVGGCMFKPFQISDFMYYGDIEDIKGIFDRKPDKMNMSSEEREAWINSLIGTVSAADFYNITAPEMHLIYDFAKKSYDDLKITIKDYWEYVKDGLIMIGWGDSELYWPKYGLYNEAKIDNSVYPGVNGLNAYNWDFSKWLMLYSGQLKYKESYEKYAQDVYIRG